MSNCYNGYMVNNNNISRSKLTEMSVEELKSVLNDEDHFDKFLMELETDYQPLGNIFMYVVE